MGTIIIRSVVLAFGLSILVARLGAESSDEAPTPREPLLPRAPEMAAWTITYKVDNTKSASTESATPSGQPKYIPETLTLREVVKTGNTYHLTSTYSTGRKEESWIVGGKEVTPQGAYFLCISAGVRYDDYSKSDFEELTWLSTKFYTGYKKRGKLPVFVFSADNAKRSLTAREKMEFEMGSAVAAPLGASPDQIKALRKKAADSYLAFTYGNTTSMVQIDASTQMPIEWDDGKIDRVYQFEAPPTETIVLPPEIAAQYKLWAQQAH